MKTTIDSTMNPLAVNTPHDVLLDGKIRLGPGILPVEGDARFVAIYGFSDKQSYDLFCANSELALAPYPLVKGYLQNQMTDRSAAVHLVVVDAAGPNEAQLNAATMQSVLEALEQEVDLVTVSFRLRLDQESHAYRVEKALLGNGQTDRPAETKAM